MPTQEERLNILEYDLKQYKTETIKAYGEMAVEMTMVKGLTEDAVRNPIAEARGLLLGKAKIHTCWRIARQMYSLS
jgi:hypothetical protein